MTSLSVKVGVEYDSLPTAGFASCADTARATKPPGTREDTWLWSLDPNGNRLTQHFDGVLTNYTNGLNNEMTEAGVEDFTYDHFGNTSAITGQQAFTYTFLRG